MSAVTSADKHYRDNIPVDFLPFIVDQHYDAYTEVNHQTWRTLYETALPIWTEYAHPDFLKGLDKTGIWADKVPSIANMNECLKSFGWGAVPVSGFIAPRAFMGLQAHGFLPVAAEIRKPENLGYTPAPDIFHEAAAHAPLLINPDYSRFLKRFGQLALEAGFTDDDQRQYDAIRYLSDIKEKPDTPPEAIAAAEAALKQVSSEMKETSVGKKLTSFYWWTVEYGLIGDMQNPKIYGAGLLSSIVESKDCFGSHVKKLPLTLDCMVQDYDITKPQPQLFVTKSFEQVYELLETFAATL